MKPICLFAGILLFSTLAYSQETRGQILGRVTDPSGAVMSGATVKAVDTATNVQTTTTTNSSGDYVLPFLISGTYNVEAEMAGFRTFEQESVLVQVGDKATLDIVLQIGSASERVVVVGSAPLVETANASLGNGGR